MVEDSIRDEFDRMNHELGNARSILLALADPDARMVILEEEHNMTASDLDALSRDIGLLNSYYEQNIDSQSEFPDPDTSPEIEGVQNVPSEAQENHYSFLTYLRDRLDSYELPDSQRADYRKLTTVPQDFMSTEDPARQVTMDEWLYPVQTYQLEIEDEIEVSNTVSESFTIPQGSRVAGWTLAKNRRGC